MVDVRVAGGQTVRIAADRLKRENGMAGRRKNTRNTDTDFKAGFAAGKRAFAKRPGTVSASDGERHYSRVSSKYGMVWKSGYNAALDAARGATKTKAARKAARLGLTSSGRDRSMVASYEADQYGRAARSHKANGADKPLRKADKAVIAAFTERRAATGHLLSSNGSSLSLGGFGGGKVAAWKGGKIAMGQASSRLEQQVQRAVKREAPKNHLANGRKKNSGWAARLSVAQQQRGMVVAPRKNARKNARKSNTHLKVGQRVAYAPMPGVFGKISKARAGDHYDVTWEASGQTQPNLPGNKLKKAGPHKANSGRGVSW